MESGEIRLMLLIPAELIDGLQQNWQIHVRASQADRKKTPENAARK